MRNYRVQMMMMIPRLSRKNPCVSNTWNFALFQFRFRIYHAVSRMTDILLLEWCCECKRLQRRNIALLANVNSRTRSLYVVIRPSVCRLSVTFVRSTQAIEIFCNIFTPFGTWAIYDLSLKILRRSSQGNASVGGVKHKRDSRI